MAAQTATAATARTGGDVSAELAFLTRALKAPTLRECGRAAGRTGPRRDLDPRGVPGRLPATRGLRPRVPRRRGPHPRRPLPRPQVPGGVRLRPRPRPQTRDHRPPGHPGLRHRQGQRRVPRPARHRQDPPGDRAGDPGLPGRAPGRVRHRRRMGRPPRRGPPRRPAARRAAQAGPLSRCWSSTRSATSPSNPKPRTCSSSSSPSATNAPSLIVTSNKPFGRWGEVFGDDVVAAAMIDRLVHHAEVIALKGDSYRLKDRDLGRVPAATNDD